MPRLNSNENLFTSKLEQILEDPETQIVIRWGQNKYTIQINDKTKLIENILPKFFRHSRFESFVRQMNLYGFKKIRSSKSHCFINSELKNGKRLTELKSKNQLKRQHNYDSSLEEQSINQEKRNESQKNRLEPINKQIIQCVEPSQQINTIENLNKINDQTSLQRQISYFYCQTMPQNFIQIQPFKNYSLYPYSFIFYQ